MEIARQSRMGSSWSKKNKNVCLNHFFTEGDDCLGCVVVVFVSRCWVVLCLLMMQFLLIYYAKNPDPSYGNTRPSKRDIPYGFLGYTLPETNSSHLKHMCWKIKFLFGARHLFRCELLMKEILHHLGCKQPCK